MTALARTATTPAHVTGDVMLFAVELAIATDAVRQLQTDLWSEVGGRLSCNEADQLVRLFQALGLHEHARSLAAAHAEHDEPEDSHYQGAPT